MEWLLVFMFHAGYKGALTTERFTTQGECVRVGQSIDQIYDNTYMFSQTTFKCIKVKKLEK